MERAKEAMEGGHTFLLNDIRTQLKSMCFRNDGTHADAIEAPNVRAPLQKALAELERHAALNETLRARALSEGYSWDLLSGMSPLEVRTLATQC